MLHDGLGGELAPLVEARRPAHGRQPAEGLADLAKPVVGPQLDQVGVACRQQEPDRGPDRLVAERAGNRFIEDRELGVDPDLERMPSQQPGAELVERPDRCRVQATEHGPPSRRVLRRRQLGPASGANTLPELPSRLLGERQGDQGAERDARRHRRARPGTARSTPSSCRNRRPRSGPRWRCPPSARDAAGRSRGRSRVKKPRCSWLLIAPKGPKQISPGQRPGEGHNIPRNLKPCKGGTIEGVVVAVTPFQGSDVDG